MKYSSLWILACIAVTAVVTTAEPVSLKESYRGDFLIGAAIGNRYLKAMLPGQKRLLEDQFSSVTAENVLKWSSFNPKPGVYRYELADEFVRFGSAQRMYVVGHVLFWHEQTPEWVFRDAEGKPLGREQLLERMTERVRHVARRYNNRIDAWDVVNEAYMNHGGLRQSPWTKGVGGDFIEQAFRIASRELPESVDLIYNDFAMTQPAKRKAVVAMVKDLKSKKVRIDGVGMQGHWSLEKPSLKEIEESIVAYANAGVQVHITELDIEVLPRDPAMFGVDWSKQPSPDPAMNPYVNGLSQEMQQKLARRYADIFALFIKHHDKIKRVTFWGVTDEDSWLNHWPMKGRTNHPLLFDRGSKRKPAFDAVLGLKAAH